MSSLWGLGASIAGASAEVATTAVSGVGTAVRAGTTNLVNTTTNVASGSLRKVGSTVSPYIPSIPITNAAQFAYSSTYYVSDNTIRAVQLLPNLIDLCKRKETENITLCSVRLLEKLLSLLKCDEVAEIAKLIIVLANSEVTTQLLNEIKELLLELFALLRTAEADALKTQLTSLIEGLKGIAREHERNKAAHDKTDQKLDNNEQSDNPPTIPQRSAENLSSVNSFPWMANLDEIDGELVRTVVIKAKNPEIVIEKLALIGITRAQATELWNYKSFLYNLTFDRNPLKMPKS